MLYLTKTFHLHLPGFCLSRHNKIIITLIYAALLQVTEEEKIEIEKRIKVIEGKMLKIRKLIERVSKGEDSAEDFSETTKFMTSKWRHVSVDSDEDTENFEECAEFKLNVKWMITATCPRTCGICESLEGWIDSEF